MGRFKQGFQSCLLLLYFLVEAAFAHEGLQIDIAVESDPLKRVEIDYGLYKKQFLASEHRLLIFVSVYTFKIYSIIRGRDLEFLNEVSHSMVDFDEGFTFISCSHETISIVTENNLYLYKLSTEDYSVVYARAFPAQYFANLTKFTDVVTTNHWNISLIVKTGTNELHVMDLRSVVKPIATLITPAISKGSNEIERLLVSNYGKSVCIFYSDNTFYGLDLESQSIKTFPSLPEGKRFIVHYDYVSNFVLLVMDKTLYLYNSMSGEFAGSIDLAISSPISSDKHQWVLSETGTSIILLNDINRMYFINIEKRQMYPNYLDSRKILEENEFTLMAEPIKRSSIVQTTKSKSHELRKFLFFKLKTNGSDFCHPSCGKSCEEPFIPCKNLFKLVSSFLGASVGLTGFLYLMSLLCIRFEKTPMSLSVSAEKERPNTNEQNLEEEKDEFNESINLHNNPPMLNTRQTSGTSINLNKKISFHDPGDEFTNNRTSRKSTLR